MVGWSRKHKELAARDAIIRGVATKRWQTSAAQHSSSRVALWHFFRMKRAFRLQSRISKNPPCDDVTGLSRRPCRTQTLAPTRRRSCGPPFRQQEKGSRYFHRGPSETWLRGLATTAPATEIIQPNALSQIDQTVHFVFAILCTPVFLSVTKRNEHLALQCPKVSGTRFRA